MAQNNIPHVNSRTIYGDGLRRAIYQQPNTGYWQNTAAEHQDDAIGVRRLVYRSFQTSRSGDSICMECVLTRVGEDVARSGWSYDTVLYLEGHESPYKWHHDNRPAPYTPPDGELEEGGSAAFLRMVHSSEQAAATAARHEAQNALSRMA